MEIKLNRLSFLNNFLNPINKISDKGIFKIKSDGIECLSTSSHDKKDQTVILFSKYSDTITLSENQKEIKLNIPNINKLINVFSFLKEDDVCLKIDNNSLSYNSKESEISFKYHLLEDGVLESPSVKMENVYKMGFTFECTVDNSTLKSILKGASFADQTNKLYLYTRDNKTFCVLTDENLKNIDNIEFKISDSYIGDDIKKKIPMSLEIYRVISSLNFDVISIKINIENGVIMFEVKNEKNILQYIVTALIK